MGRSVQCGFITRLLKDGSQHVAGTAFSVRAGNMDAFKTFFRMVQVPGEMEGGMEIGLVCRLPHSLVHGQLLKEPGYGFCVGDGQKF